MRAYAHEIQLSTQIRVLTIDGNKHRKLFIFYRNDSSDGNETLVQMYKMFVTGFLSMQYISRFRFRNFIEVVQKLFLLHWKYRVEIYCAVKENTAHWNSIALFKVFLIHNEEKIQDNIHNWIIAFSTSNSTIPNIRAPFIHSMQTVI